MISYDDYFDNLLKKDLYLIPNDIKEAHKNDSSASENDIAVEEVLRAFEEVQKTDNTTQTQMIMYSKIFKINLPRSTFVQDLLPYPAMIFRGLQAS